MSRRDGLKKYNVYVAGNCSATIRVMAESPEEAKRKVVEFDDDCYIYDEDGPEYDFWAVENEDVYEVEDEELDPLEEEEYE